MNDTIRYRIAEAIWQEERKVFELLYKKPTDSFLNGVLRGLQRARDIAEGKE